MIKVIFLLRCLALKTVIKSSLCVESKSDYLLKPFYHQLYRELICYTVSSFVSVITQHKCGLNVIQIHTSNRHFHKRCEILHRASSTPMYVPAAAHIVSALHPLKRRVNDFAHTADYRGGIRRKRFPTAARWRLETIERERHSGGYGAICCRYPVTPPTSMQKPAPESMTGIHRQIDATERGGALELIPPSTLRFTASGDLPRRPLKQ